MGFVVGGIFGGLTGLYYAIQYRTIYYIPMIALTSGGSFGFFMGIGMVMRAEMEPKSTNSTDESITSESDSFMVKKIDPLTGELS